MTEKELNDAVKNGQLVQLCTIQELHGCLFHPLTKYLKRTRMCWNGLKRKEINYDKEMVRGVMRFMRIRIESLCRFKTDSYGFKEIWH